MFLLPDAIGFLLSETRIEQSPVNKFVQVLLVLTVKVTSLVRAYGVFEVFLSFGVKLPLSGCLCKLGVWVL